MMTNELAHLPETRATAEHKALFAVCRGIAAGIAHRPNDIDKQPLRELFDGLEKLVAMSPAERAEAGGFSLRLQQECTRLDAALAPFVAHYKRTGLDVEKHGFKKCYDKMRHERPRAESDGWLTEHARLEEPLEAAARGIQCLMVAGH